MGHLFIRESEGIFHSSVSCVHEHYAACLPFIKSLPKRFDQNEGEVIYKGRNELREFHYNGHDLIVKSFRKPILINQIVYGLIRSSKAQRSFEYAEMFLKAGIHTPQPVGYYTERSNFLFTRSYYVSLKSECPFLFRDIKNREFPRYEEIVKAVAETTAKMHEKGFLHKDYSDSNILFRDDREQIQVEVIDLNRMAFQQIDERTGCKNFERLFCTEEMLSVLADVYAHQRGFDPAACFKYMKIYTERWKKKKGRI